MGDFWSFTLSTIERDSFKYLLYYRSPSPFHRQVSISDDTKQRPVPSDYFNFLQDTMFSTRKYPLLHSTPVNCSILEREERDEQSGSGAHTVSCTFHNYGK